MQTAMLTPLFPPDTSDSAVYAKQLASKLATNSLTVIAYGKLPESVTNTNMISIDKSGLKIVTVLRCLLALYKVKPSTLLTHNGPSTDLPALLYKITHPNLQLLYIESDKPAATRNKSPIAQFIHTQLIRRSIATITLPQDRNLFLPTEVMPFQDADNRAEKEKRIWWNNHLKLINSYASK